LSFLFAIQGFVRSIAPNAAQTARSDTFLGGLTSIYAFLHPLSWVG